MESEKIRNLAFSSLLIIFCIARSHPCLAGDHPGAFSAFFLKEDRPGEWCNYKGSVRISIDLNEDGIVDQLCKDTNGLEAVINGQRLLYGYPALRSRVTTWCKDEMDGFAVSPKEKIIVCVNRRTSTLSVINDFHTYLKPLF